MIFAKIYSHRGGRTRNFRCYFSHEDNLQNRAANMFNEAGVYAVELYTDEEISLVRMYLADQDDPVPVWHGKYMRSLTVEATVRHRGLGHSNSPIGQAMDLFK